MYTSGSTGGPKGVTLTHQNLAFVTGSIVEYLEMTAADRVLCVMQLSFGYGLSQLLACVRVGATLALEAGIAFPGRIVQALERHRITGLPGVPTIFQVLTSLKGLADRELPDLRFLTNAGASMPVATVEAVRRTFPQARLYLMYGLTECIRVSYLPPGSARCAARRRPGSPIPGTDAWIEGADGKRRRGRRGGGADGPGPARDAGVLAGSRADGGAHAARPLAVGAGARARATSSAPTRRGTSTGWAAPTT